MTAQRNTLQAPVARPPSGPAIEVRDLSLTLGRTQVLGSVNVTVSPGSVHAIIGPNGGGKSSFVRCLLGQLPFRGQVSLIWPDVPGRIAYVPQAVQFDAGLPMTVLDFLNVLDGPRPGFLRTAADRRATLQRRLSAVGMADKADRRMGALSGGERQRVLLAQALDPLPDLLILDEPMAAMDASGAQIFDELLGRLRASGVTVLWIEHDMDAVRRLADHVTALNRSVCFDGPAHELTAAQLVRLFSHRIAHEL